LQTLNPRKRNEKGTLGCPKVFEKCPNFLRKRGAQSCSKMSPILRKKELKGIQKFL
jgi:hypothetical protein